MHHVVGIGIVRSHVLLLYVNGYVKNNVPNASTSVSCIKPFLLAAK